MNKKLNLNVPFLLGIFLIGIFSPNVSQSQTNAYWDVNGTNAGQGGTGTFSSSSVFWTTNSENATADGGGPTGGGTFAVGNGAANGTTTYTTNGATWTSNSGAYTFNFGGSAGTVTQGGSYQAVGINFLSSGYVLTIDGTGSNARKFTTTNGVNLGANALTLANGSRGLNSFTFDGPTTATAVGITGENGSTLNLRNLVADTATNSFGVYLTGGTISSNIGINVDIGTGSKMFLGSQSSGGATINSAITLNTNASGVALNITNSSSGTVALNGVISGNNGLVLDNSSSGKILLSASNTYSGGTTLNNSGSGTITISNAAAFGTGTITSAGAITNYVRAEASAFNITNNWQINNGSTLRLNANNSGWNVTASGVIAGAGSMMFSNSGVNYFLTGTDNSFGGGVSVGNGTLYFNKFGSAGQNSSLGTNGTITVNGGTTTGGLRWNGTTNETSDKTIVLAGTTGGLNLYAEGATNSTLTISGNINSTGAGAKTLNFAGYGTTNSYNTLILNGLINENGGVNSVVIGTSQSGTVVLGNTNNSFSGAIRITNSTGATLTVLSVANIGTSGVNSALGKNGTINIGGKSVSAVTVLQYTGTGETSDKVINLSSTSTNLITSPFAGGATLDQSGTGNLKFTSAITATGVGAKTITLQGSTAGTGELGAAISDLDGNVISLSKSGSGTWRLSGVNTYTGLTTIGSGQNGWAGTLKIVLTNGLVNGVLAGASGAANMGMLDLTAGGSYVMNSYGNSTDSGQNMSFTNSSVIASTLTFTNANNYITIASQGGKTLTNAASNLTIVFNGAVDIGSSTNNNVTFTGPGSFTFNGALNSTGDGVRGLIKSGDGTLTLKAASAYKGDTAVNGGKLVMANPQSLPASSPTVFGGGQLKVDYAGASSILGNMQLTADSTLDAGTNSASTLNFASATNWPSTTNILKISSYYPVGAKIYILNTGDVPLAQIKKQEDTNAVASLDAFGLLIFTSGSTYTSVGYTAGTESEIAANGLSNLMNYALGQNGPSASFPATPALSTDSNAMTLTAKARTDDSSLKFYGQWTHDLSANDWELVGHSTELTPPDLSYSQTIDPMVSTKFIRFKVLKQ